MRSKLCPIVTFQTERKGKLGSSSSPRNTAGDAHVRQARSRPYTGRQHGKPKVKTLRVRVEMLGAGEVSTRGRKANFHSTGRNCGIPATGSNDCRIVPFSRWNCRDLLVT